MIVSLPGVGGRLFEVGLHWHSVEQTRVREIARTEEFARYCQVGHSVAFSGVSPRRDKGGARCEPLLLIVAEALGGGRCAVVLDEVVAQDDQGAPVTRWWLAVILDGLVIQDALFVSLADAHGRLEQLQRVHGTLTIDLWLGAALVDVEVPIHSLMDRVVAAKKRSWQRVGVPAGWVAAGVVTVCLVAGYLLWAPQERATPGELHQWQIRRVENARAEHERVRHRALGRQPVAQLLLQYRAWIEAPQYAARWHRETMSCGTECKSLWRGKSGAQISVLQALHPSAQLSEDSLFKAVTTDAITPPVQQPLTADNRARLEQYARGTDAQDVCQWLLHRGAVSCQVTAPVAVRFQGSELLAAQALIRSGSLDIEMSLPVYTEYQRLVQQNTWLKHESFEITKIAQPVIRIKNLFVLKGEEL